MASFKRSCHCTHACPSRVHCSNDEASSHLEQSNSPVVDCSRAVHRGPAEQLNAQSHPTFRPWASPSTRQLKCSKPTPLFGRRPQGRNRTNQLNSTTLLPTTFWLEAADGSRKPNSTNCCPPPRESLMPSHPPYKYSPCQLIDP